MRPDGKKQSGHAFSGTADEAAQMVDSLAVRGNLALVVFLLERTEAGLADPGAAQHLLSFAAVLGETLLDAVVELPLTFATGPLLQVVVLVENEVFDSLVRDERSKVIRVMLDNGPDVSVSYLRRNRRMRRHFGFFRYRGLRRYRRFLGGHHRLRRYRGPCRDRSFCWYHRQR